jgi:hypothetical protein
MSIRKNVTDFTLLHKLLAEPSCLHPPHMASVVYCSGIPSLPTMPSPDRNDSKCSWLIVVCLGAKWVAPRRPWDDGGCHGRKVCLALILLAFCMPFYVEAIAVVAENRLRSIINDNFSSLYYVVGLLPGTLANVSMPWSWGWGTMAATG